MPRIKERCRGRHRRPTTTYPPSDDDDDFDDDDDDDLDEVAELRAKEERQRAQRRAARARYRARHPEQVAAEKRRYRARYPEKVAAAKRRHREKYRARLCEAYRQYYASHWERLRAYYKQRDQTEHRRAWRAQYKVKRREAIALAAARERWRTGEKIKALGPLKLTVVLEDCLKSPSVNTPVETYLDTFCQSLEADDRPQPSFCQLLDDSYALTDLDSGGRRPLDRPVWDQWLDDLLEDLSKDNISDLSLDDLLKDMSSDNISDLSFDDLSSSSSSSLCDLSSSKSDDSLYDLLSDMSPDEGAQLGEEPSFDLDDFVS